MINKIISGGQSGADRAALDCAIAIGLEYGGWIPKERLAEDGPISAKYESLTETGSADYEERTRLNVETADGTLILSHGPLKGGSRLTMELALEIGKPWLHIDFNVGDRAKAVIAIRVWIKDKKINVINIAGSRASEDPRIYRAAYDLLTLLLD